MTPRERALRCLERKRSDRLCLDGTFRPEVWDRLKKHFETEESEEVKRRLGIDFLEGIGLNDSYEWLERSIETDLGRGIVREDGSLEDEWGSRQIRGSSGPYIRYVDPPLVRQDLDSYRFPDLDAPGRWEGVQGRLNELRKEYLVVAGTSTFFRQGWDLRGLGNWLCDIAEENRLMVALLDRLLEYKLEYVRRFAEMGVDAISIGGDIAHKDGLFMRPATWRKHLKWRDAALIEEARKHGVRYFYFHTDGNLMEVMEDLLEMGFNIIDPIQPECMNPYEVKERFGGRMVLHGTVSSQRTLPFGTVEQVREEVRERVSGCGYDNGLVIAPNNVVQFDVPLENLLAVYDTVKEIGADFYLPGGNHAPMVIGSSPSRR